MSGLGGIGEARLREIIGALHEGLQIVDRELRYVYLNDAALVHAQRTREELIGKRMADLYPGIDATPMYATLVRCLETGQLARLDNEFEYPDGTRRSFLLSVQPVPEGLVILSTDVTEPIELQRQLRHAQKLEAIGRLASGVAHDFNNLLSVIDIFTQVALESLAEDAEARGDLAEVLRASQRAGELTSKLLTFSRQRATRDEVMNLNALVGDMGRMLGRLLRDDIEVITHLASDLWDVHIDPVGIEQVLMNLVVNARDAMPSGGQLVIETTNAEIDEEVRMRWGRPIRPGDYVVLAVSDTGIGIEHDIQERLFDPFFTTKPPGEGTGLGLSVCFGIIESAGGYIGVYSEPGRGSVFRVYLPRAQGEARPEARTQRPEPGGRGEIVAVVEDDPQVRAAMVRSLERLGYAPIEIANGDAFAAVSAIEKLDLVITDVIMPGESGPSLVQRVRSARPGVRALYVSGYPGGAALERALIDAGEEFLEKPFTPSAFARAVRAALGD